MKWFQVDSDMPDDPKIRAVARTVGPDGIALGPEGIGGLVGIWCHVAKHGRKPGQGIDSRGVPLPIDDLIAASLLTPEKFAALIATCTRTGHFRADAWERHHGIWIPAMERRADRYTQRLVRSRQFELDWDGGR